MIEPIARNLEDINVGDTLPPLHFDIDMASLVMYAGATWDFHRMHYDADYAATVGLSGPVMDGQMVGALLARVLMQWGGENAFVKRLNYRQGAMVFIGEKLVIGGTVMNKDPKLRLISFDLFVIKANGMSVVRDASAVVEL